MEENGKHMDYKNGKHMDYKNGNQVNRLVKQLSLAQAQPGQDQNANRL